MIESNPRRALTASPRPRSAPWTDGRGSATGRTAFRVAPYAYRLLAEGQRVTLDRLGAVALGTVRDVQTCPMSYRTPVSVAITSATRLRVGSLACQPSAAGPARKAPRPCSVPWSSAPAVGQSARPGAGPGHPPPATRRARPWRPAAIPPARATPRPDAGPWRRVGRLAAAAAPGRRDLGAPSRANLCWTYGGSWVHHAPILSSRLRQPL